jgi:hypothetical protein
MPTERFGSPRRFLKPLGRAAEAISAELGESGDLS